MVDLSDVLNVTQSVIFQTSLKKCGCNSDEKYTKEFGVFYKTLIEKGIILAINRFKFFNHREKFVGNKYLE